MRCVTYRLQEKLFADLTQQLSLELKSRSYYQWLKDLTGKGNLSEALCKGGVFKVN